MYIGLDLAFGGTGFCILHSRNDIIRDSGDFSAPKSVGLGPARLGWFRDRIKFILNRYDIKGACVEGYSFGSNSGKAFTIGELGGVVRLLLSDLDIPTIIMPPSNVKQFATSSGTSKKDQMMLAVYKKWNEEFKSDNECDAYVLARIARAFYFRDGSLTEYQRKVMKKASVLIPKKPTPRVRSRK